MIKIRDLTTRIDQNVWISDDRISALISHASQSIEQIDYHGAQPVSRNAKLLQHSNGVLKFEICYEIDGEKIRLPISWENLTITPGSIQTAFENAIFENKLSIAVLQDTCSASCSVRLKKSDINLSDLQFKVFWNRESLTKEVHGQRNWERLSAENQTALHFKATDAIELQSWMQRTGDYAGDFLIPEGWRRMIFDRQIISGLARYDDLRPEYQDTSLKIYDADTIVTIVSDEFSTEPAEENWLLFKASFKKTSYAIFESPRFEIRFAHKNENAQVRQKIEKEPFVLQSEKYRNLAVEAPKLKLNGFPAIEAFFAQTPLVVESAKVGDVGMTRACPGTYYWIWAWDNMVTAPAMLRWGDATFVSRIAAFINHHRDVDGAITGRWSRSLEPMDSRGIGGMDFLFSELVLSLFTETGDRQALLANYASLLTAFRQLKSRCHPNGLFPSIGMYPDIPAKMGRTEHFYVAIDQGAWYCLCRNLEKIASFIGDLPTAEQARSTAQHISSNFLSTFWNDDKGFLCDSFNPDGKKQFHSFPIFSLLFLESSFGWQLIRNKIDEAATFIENHLLSENGMKMTPSWDINHFSEPAMSGWYPHWDLPAVKLLVRAGKWSAVQKWLNLVEECYSRLGYCPEFIATNHEHDQIWFHHGAAWNLNCATGWYQALLFAIFGIEFDTGGITCFPTQISQNASLKGMNFRTGRWNISKLGRGQYISHLKIDGEQIFGSLKVPTKFYTNSEHTIIIYYENQKPDFPVLTELIGAELIDIQHSKKGTAFTIRGVGTTDVEFSSYEKPTIIFDKKRIPFIWEEKKKSGSFQTELNGNHQLAIQIKI